eukprot:529009_1
MMSRLKQTKLIDNEIKYVVLGYIRKCEHKLNLFTSFPTMLSYICLSYYSHGEYFETCGSDIYIESNDRTIITNQQISSTSPHHFRRSESISYCKMLIESNTNQIVTWTLQLHHTTIEACIAVISNNPSLSYGFDSIGNIAKWECGILKEFYYSCPNIRFTAGDKIMVILNTYNRSLSMRKNEDKNVHCILVGIEKHEMIKYRLAVTLPCLSASISMIDFTCQTI